MTKKSNKELPFRFVPPTKFQDAKHKWQYRFPIPSNMHPQYGRMEIRLEPVYRRGVLHALYLEFRQHTLPGLDTPFEILTPQADKCTVLTTFNHASKTSSFFSGVWSIGYCPDHKSVCLFSYVPDGATALCVNTLTTSVNIHYEHGGGLKG